MSLNDEKTKSGLLHVCAYFLHTQTTGATWQQLTAAAALGRRRIALVQVHTACAASAISNLDAIALRKHMQDIMMLAINVCLCASNGPNHDASHLT
jgi:hypothetical protein